MDLAHPKMFAWRPYDNVYTYLHVKCNILVLRQLLEHSVRLSRISETDSHQKTVFIGKHRLNFSVGEGLEICRVDERIASTVQSHLTVNLTRYTQQLLLLTERAICNCKAFMVLVLANKYAHDGTGHDAPAGHHFVAVFKRFGTHCAITDRL